METYKLIIEIPSGLRLGQHIYNQLDKEISKEDLKQAQTPIAYDYINRDNKARLADKLHSITNKDLGIALLEQLNE